MLSKTNILIICFLISNYLHHVQSQNEMINEERKMKLAQGYPLDSLLNFTELTAEYGYQSEEHTVITEDGYILTIFRIIKGKKCLGPIRRPPVLLMHGLLLSSDCWLDSGPDSGLAYLISDACYDLWVGNVRGNYYGKRHAFLNVTDIDFWQFSVNEIGKYDMPATIDYILKVTSSQKLNYVGYSQGGSTFFIMCSEREGYSDKVGVFIGLEPDSRNTYTKSVFSRIAAELYQDFEPLLTEIGLYEAVPWGGVVQQMAAFVCKDYVVADTFCRGVMYIIDSPHPDSVDTETIRVLVGHFPAGTSVKNIIWYTQSLNVDAFQKYDYGSEGNMELYNSTKPPAYNLSAVATPVVIMNGRNDFLTVPADEEWLVSHLPNVIEHYIVEDPLWNHVDVPYSKLTSKNILPKILQYLLKYSDDN